MTSVDSKIHAAASRNRELLAILAETDYAPPALDQQKRYIADLENEIRQLDSTIKKLEVNRQKELKDHEKYRDSVMKRFAYKVTRKTDKFDAKAEKEEKEYFDVLHQEHQAKEARKSTSNTLTEAQATRSNLEPTAARHKKAQTDLDDLYDSIFEGPTPGFPEEDASETNANQALTTYHTTRSQSEAETQVVDILHTASRNMQSALNAMDEARSHSRMDMFGGGTMSDMMERSALARADQLCMQTQLLLMQAQRLSPHVKSIPKPTIAQGNLMSDVFFDNVFTDMAFHDKIKASQEDVGRCAKLVIQEEHSARVRLNDLNGMLVGQGRALEDSRVQLQKVRETAFETVAAGGSSSGGYHQTQEQQQQYNGGGVGNGTEYNQAPPPAYT